MIQRRRAGFAAAAFTVAALLALPLAAAAQSAEPPRTAWGAPDLGGVWDFRTNTPLERPEELADRSELTQEEAAARRAELSELLVDREPPPGDPGGYNVFWVDTPAELLDQRSSLIVDPADGKLPALVDGAINQVGSLAEDVPVDGPVRFRAGGAGTEGPEARGLAERCLLGFAHGPPLTPGGYNQNVQVFQTPDHVVILNEMVHDPRIVPLDGRPRLPEDVRQWNGDGRGYWEGDTLVIESTNFTHLTASFNPNAMVAIGERRHAAADGAADASQRRGVALRVHGRRPAGVHPTLHRRDPDAEVGRADLRVRVPRGELRPAEHPAGRP